MALYQRVSQAGSGAESPEDYLSSALAIIFPDDATNQHGDSEHDVLYTSPFLRRPLLLSLTNPDSESVRTLFSQYVWNASLQLAEFIEGAAVVTGAAGGGGGGGGVEGLDGTDEYRIASDFCNIADFCVTGLATVELGAGTGLPSIMAAHFGARKVTVTDYPTPTVLDNVRSNLARNYPGEAQESDGVEAQPALATVSVYGHRWGHVDSPEAQADHHGADRVFVCDCLWMSWQHDQLRQSVSWFLKEDAPVSAENMQAAPSRPRCWVVAGIHTGRVTVAKFFDDVALAAAGLEVEHIWERDCNGAERPWAADRGIEDKAELKRWLIVAVLRRRAEVP